MDVNPRQYDPEFQDPNAADSERKSQFGMQSQADMPLGTDTAQPSAGPAWGQRDIVATTPVFGSDGKKVGTVQEAARDYFMVKKGIFFVHDYYIPYGAIASSDPERIVLTISSDEAKQQDWQQPPTTGTGSAAGMAGMPGTAGGIGAGAAAAQLSGQQPEYGVYGPEGPDDTVQAATERGTEGSLGATGTAGTPGATAIPGTPPADQPLTPSATSPDVTPQVPPGSAAPNRPATTSAAPNPDTPIPMGPANPPRQGDMPYRNTMGPMDEPDAADRAYNPGWQGRGGSGRDSASNLPQPEEDPTSWNPDQQRPNDGTRP